jgi:hypothetical protein
MQTSVQGAGTGDSIRCAGEVTVRDQFWASASGQRLLLRLALPAEQEDVAVRHGLDVMVREVGVVRKPGKRPDHLTLPRHLFDVACGPTSPECDRDLVLGAVSQQVARWQEVGREDVPARVPLMSNRYTSRPAHISV